MSYVVSVSSATSVASFARVIKVASAALAVWPLDAPCSSCSFAVALPVMIKLMNMTRFQGLGAAGCITCGSAIAGCERTFREGRV